MSLSRRRTNADIFRPTREAFVTKFKPTAPPTEISARFVFDALLARTGIAVTLSKFDGDSQYYKKMADKIILQNFKNTQSERNEVFIFGVNCLAQGLIVNIDEEQQDEDNKIIIEKIEQDQMDAYIDKTTELRNIAANLTRVANNTGQQAVTDINVDALSNYNKNKNKKPDFFKILVDDIGNLTANLKKKQALWESYNNSITSRPRAFKDTYVICNPFSENFKKTKKISGEPDDTKNRELLKVVHPQMLQLYNGIIRFMIWVHQQLTMRGNNYLNTTEKRKEFYKKVEAMCQSIITKCKDLKKEFSDVRSALLKESTEDDLEGEFDKIIEILTKLAQAANEEEETRQQKMNPVELVETARNDIINGGLMTFNRASFFSEGLHDLLTFRENGRMKTSTMSGIISHLHSFMWNYTFYYQPQYIDDDISKLAQIFRMELVTDDVKEMSYMASLGYIVSGVPKFKLSKQLERVTEDFDKTALVDEFNNLVADMYSIGEDVNAKTVTLTKPFKTEITQQVYEEHQKKIYNSLQTDKQQAINSCHELELLRFEDKIFDGAIELRYDGITDAGTATLKEYCLLVVRKYYPREIMGKNNPIDINDSLLYDAIEMMYYILMNKMSRALDFHGVTNIRYTNVDSKMAGHLHDLYVIASTQKRLFPQIDQYTYLQLPPSRMRLEKRGFSAAPYSGLLSRFFRAGYNALSNTICLHVVNQVVFNIGARLFSNYDESFTDSLFDMRTSASVASAEAIPFIRPHWSPQQLAGLCLGATALTAASYYLELTRNNIPQSRREYIDDDYEDDNDDDDEKEENTRNAQKKALQYAKVNSMSIIERISLSPATDVFKVLSTVTSYLAAAAIVHALCRVNISHTNYIKPDNIKKWMIDRRVNKESFYISQTEELYNNSEYTWVTAPVDFIKSVRGLQLQGQTYSYYLPAANSSETLSNLVKERVTDLIGVGNGPLSNIVSSAVGMLAFNYAFPFTSHTFAYARDNGMLDPKAVAELTNKPDKTKKAFMSLLDGVCSSYGWRVSSNECYRFVSKVFKVFPYTQTQINAAMVIFRHESAIINLHNEEFLRSVINRTNYSWSATMWFFLDKIYITGLLFLIYFFTYMVQFNAKYRRVRKKTTNLTKNTTRMKIMVKLLLMTAGGGLQAATVAVNVFGGVARQAIDGGLMTRQNAGEGAITGAVFGGQTSPTGIALSAAFGAASTVATNTAKDMIIDPRNWWTGIRAIWNSITGEDGRRTRNKENELKILKFSTNVVTKMAIENS